MSSNQLNSDKIPFLTRFFRALSLDLKIPKRIENNACTQKEKRIDG